MNSGNACYHSMQNILSFYWEFKDTKTNIHNCNFSVVLCGCETWSFTMAEKHRLKVFENRVLRKMFGPNRDEVTGDFRRIHNEELYDLYSSPNIIWMWYSVGKRRVGHEEDRREEVYVGFWWGTLRGRDYFDCVGIGERIILKWVFRKKVGGLWGGGLWTGLIWLSGSGYWHVLCCVVHVNESSGSTIFLD